MATKDTTTDDGDKRAKAGSSKHFETALLELIDEAYATNAPLIPGLKAAYNLATTGDPNQAPEPAA
jgi:hypothetical protein